MSTGGITTTSSQVDMQDFVQKVKERADFLAIVGRYTKLIRSGGRYKGCCPFHKEKTPSFYVNPEEGFFHCFGCDTGGDILTFLMKIEGQSFFETLKELARDLHMEMPEKFRRSSESQNTEKRSELEGGHALLERVALFFQKILLNGATPGAQRALDYLKKRNIPESEIQELTLGWAPESGRELLQRIRDPQDLRLAESLGLIRPGRQGSFEFFRARLLIPIRNHKGKICGFSGRTLDPVTSQNPKYKNSAESPWFKKKEILYGLDREAQQIRRENWVCLVEGYFDQWAFHRAGIPSVAVMGTALSAEHLRLLGRYTQKATLVLDTDSAGLESTFKAIPQFLDLGWNLSVFSDLQGKDPDEWLSSRENKSEDIMALMQRSPEALEWWSTQILKQAIAQGQPRLETYRQLSTPWKLTSSSAHRSLLADEIGRHLGIKPEQVVTDLNEWCAIPTSASAASTSATTLQEPSSLGGWGVASNPLFQSIPEELFALWIRFPEEFTPMSESDWEERAWLFARSPLGPEIPKLKSLIEETGEMNPRHWLKDLPGDSSLRLWIQKSLVLHSQEGTHSQNTDKALISFKELYSTLLKERIHNAIAQVQRKLRSLPPSSSETPQLLQKIQEYRFRLEKSK